MSPDAGAWTRASRVIRARPEELYEAFIDPAALAAWLPPAEMTGHIHEFDARVGGGYRMSLFYPPGEVAPVPKVVLNTVRVPLSSFRGVNLNTVRSVQFAFNERLQGALLITDVAFASAPQ